MATKTKQHPWQKRGYAIGLAESIEMTIHENDIQDAGMLAVSIRAEWGSYHTPTQKQVEVERARLRKTGVLTYSRHAGWRLAN